MNWKKYNESLVKRDEILLDFDVIDNWHIELEKMNQGKEGRKFVYPQIHLSNYLDILEHTFIYNTDKLRAFVRAHAANTLPSSIPDYSRICRRINLLNIKISDDATKSSLQHDDYFVIAIDSTGIKVSNREENG